MDPSLYRGSLIGLDDSPQLLSRTPAGGFTPASKAGALGGGKENAPAASRPGVADSQTTLPLFTDSPFIRGARDGRGPRAAGLPPRHPPAAGCKDGAAASTPAAAGKQQQQQQAGWQDLLNDSADSCGTFSCMSPPPPPPAAAAGQSGGEAWMRVAWESGSVNGSVLRDRCAPHQQQQQQQPAAAQGGSSKPPVCASWFGDPGKWALCGSEVSADFGLDASHHQEQQQQQAAAPGANQAAKGKAGPAPFPVEQLDLSCDSCTSSAFAFAAAARLSASHGTPLAGHHSTQQRTESAAASPAWGWPVAAEASSTPTSSAASPTPVDTSAKAAAGQPAESEQAAEGPEGVKVYGQEAQQRVCEDLLMMLSVDASVALSLAADAAPSPAPFTPAAAATGAATAGPAQREAEQAAAAACSAPPLSPSEPLMGSPVVCLDSPQLTDSAAPAAASPASAPAPAAYDAQEESPARGLALWASIEGLSPLRDQQAPASPAAAAAAVATEEDAKAAAPVGSALREALCESVDASCAAGATGGQGTADSSTPSTKRHEQAEQPANAEDETPVRAEAAAPQHGARQQEGEQASPVLGVAQRLMMAGRGADCGAASPALSDASFAAAAAAGRSTPYFYPHQSGRACLLPATPAGGAAAAIAAWRANAIAGSPGSCLGSVPARLSHFQPSPGGASPAAAAGAAARAAKGAPVGSGWGVSGSVELSVNPVAVQHLVEQLANYETRVAQLEALLSQVGGSVPVVRWGGGGSLGVWVGQRHQKTNAQQIQIKPKNRPTNSTVIKTQAISPATPGPAAASQTAAPAAELRMLRQQLMFSEREQSSALDALAAMMELIALDAGDDDEIEADATAAAPPAGDATAATRVVEAGADGADDGDKRRSPSPSSMGDRRARRPNSAAGRRSVELLRASLKALQREQLAAGTEAALQQAREQLQAAVEEREALSQQVTRLQAAVEERDALSQQVMHLQTQLDALHTDLEGARSEAEQQRFEVEEQRVELDQLRSAAAAAEQAARRGAETAERETKALKRKLAAAMREAEQAAEQARVQEEGSTAALAASERAQVRVCACVCLALRSGANWGGRRGGVGLVRLAAAIRCGLDLHAAAHLLKPHS